MSEKKKLLAAALCAAVVLTAGCGNSESSPNSGNGGSTDSTAANNSQTEVSSEAQQTEPAVTGAAAEYEWGNVKVVGGGYVTGFVYNSGEEGLVYAKTDVGGLYRRDKNNAKWKPLTDQFDYNDYTYYGIDGVAVDTKSPNKVYALAGMYGNMKAAVLCSDDYGDNWRITELPFAAGGNEPHRQANRLELDPNDSSTLYLGSRHDGLWVSHDGGASFEVVESFPTRGSGYSEDGYTFGITAIAFDPASSADGEPCKTIYIGTGDRVMYVTHDGGGTWEELEGAPKAYLANHIYVQGDDVYFVFTSTAAPYAPKKGTLRRYNKVSGEWTDITPDSTGHSWGDIEIDPNDPDTVYAVTMGRYAANEDDIIFRSTDGCKTWEPIFSGADDTDRLFRLDYSAAPWLDWGRESAVLGWMIGDFEINPFNSDELLYGTGATVYHTTNLTDWGKEPINIEVYCDGLEETVINDLCAANSDDIRLYSAMWDIDGFTHLSVDEAPAHMNGNGFMTKSLCISCGWNAPNIAARTGEGVNPISITTDGGETWKNMNRPDKVGGDEGTVAVNCDGSV
ncbi:MAG: cellulose-binding protein, partial [Ruminiclostridium sp.]|nr:cellulose-binding protein [Ruminiclostridium sp.]